MRVAIVHDWLYVLGGAEKVLQEILRCYPGADVFTLFDLLRPEDRAKLGFEKSHTSFLQNMPGLRKYHRSYLPLMPLAIEQLDLSSYDLVISSSCAVAKGVLTGPEQLHIAYVHSPMRYAWDLQHQYLEESGYATGVKGWIARALLHKMRIWDARTAHGPDAIFTNSQFVARRIKKIYGRDTKVIYPPVTIGQRDAILPVGNHFLAASRLVPYKRIEPIVRAFNAMPDLELVVAGDGPEAARLKAIAGPNVTFAGFVPDKQLRDLMTTARAFVFAAEEDFGIIPVEAQSEGAPVLALGRGGARESILTTGPRPTGMFFDSPEPEAIAACVRAFVTREKTISRLDCRQRAGFFSAERFRSQFVAAVNEELDHFRDGHQGRATRLIA
ncbi:putative Glycosyl transferase, group 1 family protein [Bradyrhizobium sp. ORS 285]|uniref:glycosyltransferase n=1 Tax=Bradyrhizobium sp. ORS 285 TaxID=115808 RepID=UPI0002407F05|nr:glycosyltransferase [Bradyrhizobium sp. ORS 285]CCD89078.1 putative Glycosyl transferase, group 1 family protein [Bradyrhizobium sp. ORS 285]SMX61790.1 putative Glycosyl transferase, group 1 family protein [Bradyrhizobium sp. ORS 285]